MLRELAGTIWRQHYAAIISAAQIDFMLAGRFSDEALRGHVQAAERWLELLRVAGTPVGYCGFEVASMDGDGKISAVMKLSQLYVLEPFRGMGLGRFMFGHVEEQASELGRRAIWLQVNKKNTGAISFYRAAGFVFVREAVMDKGYDYEDVRQAVAECGYVPQILARGEERKKKRRSPRYHTRRWMCERTHSWLNRFRRILNRWENRVANYEAMLNFARAYICYSAAAVLG